MRNESIVFLSKGAGLSWYTNNERLSSRRMRGFRKQRSPSPTHTISPPPLKRRRLSSIPDSDARSAVLPPSNAISSGLDIARRVSNLCIYSWNVNGIQPFLPSTTPPITNFLTTSSKTKAPSTQPSLRANFQRWQWPHVVFLQEVKIAPNDKKTPGLLRRVINTPESGEDSPTPSTRLYDAHLCLPRDKYNATGFGGKVYGVCTFIRKDIAPETVVKTVEWDLEGRVQVIELPISALTLFNIYAVNGTLNDYRDVNSGKVIGTRHDRKKAFHSYLANEVKIYEDKGWTVIIAGDLNISRTPIDSFPQLRMGSDHVANRADFEEKFIHGLKMLDTFRLMHGNKRKFSYRPRNKPWGAGGDRVDLMLASKGLKDAVKEADSLDTELERGPSDHVPLFVTIECRVPETKEGCYEPDITKVVYDCRG